jgi:hypothetical protein
MEIVTKWGKHSKVVSKIILFPCLQVSVWIKPKKNFLGYPGIGLVLWLVHSFQKNYQIIDFVYVYWLKIFSSEFREDKIRFKLLIAIFLL